MTIQRFEDIIAWQKGQDLAVRVYTEFGNSRDFNFKDQICRAAVSVSNNIAEGFDRNSTSKEFSRFLYISKGSCAEIKSMLYLAIRLNYILIEKANEMMKQCDEISRIIRGLIKSFEII
jgi:four helix bundle protein